MYFCVDPELREIGIEEVESSKITFGYISSAELEPIAERYGFDPVTVEACGRRNEYFRTGVDVHDTYTFTELRIVNEDGSDDWIAVYLMKNLLLVVDILDFDHSTYDRFLQALKRFPPAKIKYEKIFCAFIESLIAGGARNIEVMRNEMTKLEESVIQGSADVDFNATLLEAKKKYEKLHNYYEQLLDVTETLEDNDNEIFEEDNLIYLSNLSNKLTRLRDDTDSLTNSADHLQDAYSSLLDLRLNRTMKIFTVLTSIFFPLTIVVGWYGMNFQSMPEFGWKYGYIYVIALSVAVVAFLIWLGKKKKWF